MGPTDWHSKQPGAGVYVDTEEGRFYGEVVAVTVVNPTTGERALMVHWEDGDTTQERPGGVHVGRPPEGDPGR